METKQERITSSLDDEAIIYNEYDEALIGIDSKGRATYDINKCIEILVKRDGMDYEEATEYFWFNTEGAHFGDMTPIFVEVY
jgi:hypothetical protein